jgi:lathosterol oxidase
VLLIGNHFAARAFGWAVSDSLQAAVRALPVAVQFVVLLVCADLVQYWIHRLFHVVPWLWRFHAVHHSVHNMDWLAGSRMHVLEMVVSRALMMVPLYLVGADKAALDSYVVFAALQTVFIHANVGIPTGPLKYLLATPQYHHWHHSSERPALDTNFAVHLPILDRLFGTFHLPPEHWPAHYGTTEEHPRSFWGQLLHPFVRSDRPPHDAT